MGSRQERTVFPNFSPGPLGINVPFNEAIQLALRFGYGGLDVSIVELQQIADSHGAASISDQRAAAGLQFGIWSMPFSYRAEEENWRQGLAELPAKAALAQSLGADRTSTFIAPAADDLPWEENYEFHVARLRPIAQILADHGVRFGLEWVGPKTLRDEKKYEFIHTMAGAQQLGTDLGINNVGLLVDIFHLFTSHTDVAEVRNLSNAQVVNVHVNDAVAGRSADEQIDFERTLPAETGLTDIAGFLQALDAIGYDGPVTVEPFNQRIRDLAPADAARETAESLTKSWQLAGLSR